MLHGPLLHYLDEVARAGSIRKAAERLNIASSAVNRRILALERELGVPLFERLHKRMRLTAAGEILIAHIRGTISEHARALGTIEAMKGLRRGTVSVATMHTLASEILPDVTVRFLDRYPGATVRVQVIPEITQAVRNGEADLGFGFNLRRESGLRVHATAPVSLGAVLKPDHPLAAQASLTLADCANHPLILHERAMSIRPTLDRAFGEDAENRAGLVTNSIALMKSAARRGLGIAFLTAIDVRDECARGELVYRPLRDGAVKPESLVILQRASSASTVLANLMAEELRLTLAAFGDGLAAQASPIVSSA